MYHLKETTVALTTDPGAFLSRDDLATRYAIPKTTLDQWAHKGYGPPYIKIGRFARYRVEDVLDWEQRQGTGHAA